MAKDYRFIEKDPCVDLLRTMLQGRQARGTITRLAAEANLAPSTLMKIFYGDTKRPQNLTVEKLLIAMGYQRQLVKLETKLAIDNTSR